MRGINKTRLVEFWSGHPEAKAPLARMYRIFEAAKWSCLADVRRTLPSADAVAVASGKTATVFNVAKTGHRLIAAIHYDRQRLYVLFVLTHDEYERGRWKETL